MEYLTSEEIAQKWDVSSRCVTILTKVNEIKNNITFDLENVNMACEKIISLGYVNEWVWGKPLKSGKNMYV